MAGKPLKKKKAVPSSKKKKKTAAKKKAAPPPKKVAAKAKPKKRAAAQAGFGGTGFLQGKEELTPSTERSPVTKPEAPPATPSERLLAARAQEPTERSLTDEEREAMMKVADTARKFVGANGSDPSSIISSIATFLEDVRRGVRDEPKSQDVRLGLGVLWGEQLRAQVGWRWVHLTYPDGFASYALVPDDRAFACFPLNRIPEALRPSATNTSAHVFDSIRENTLPSRKPNAYLVIG